MSQPLAYTAPTNPTPPTSWLSGLSLPTMSGQNLAIAASVALVTAGIIYAYRSREAVETATPLQNAQPPSPTGADEEAPSGVQIATASGSAPGQVAEAVEASPPAALKDADSNQPVQEETEDLRQDCVVGWSVSAMTNTKYSILGYGLPNLYFGAGTLISLARSVWSLGLSILSVFTIFVEWGREWFMENVCNTGKHLASFGVNAVGVVSPHLANYLTTKQVTYLTGKTKEEFDSLIDAQSK